MKLAYFFEGASISYQMFEKRKQLQLLATGTMSYWIGAVTLFFILTSGYCVYGKSARVTKSIIHLLETLEDMQSKSKKGKIPVLSFKKATKELNELHRTFNKVIRSTIINRSEQTGEVTEKELLQLSEAYYIFKDFGDDEQCGICLSNIGSIMYQKHDFEMAYESFKMACEFPQN